MTDFEVNLKTLIRHNLGYEAYLVLYSLHKKDKELVIAYTGNCKKINTDIFKKLEQDNYLTIQNSQGSDESIYFESLSLTDKGKQVFTQDIDKLFKEFRDNYPASVKDNSALVPRRLHTDLQRCKILYGKLLEETTHEILCKCARLYHNEKIKSNGLMFMQNLATWLHQGNYKQYLEEIDKPEEKETSFTDDI